MRNVPILRAQDCSDLGASGPLLEALEQRLLLASAPVFATPLPDAFVITPGGGGLTVGVDGYDRDGDVLSITAVSDNPELGVFTPAGNRYARLHFVGANGRTPVAGNGDIVVQLFEGRSAAATERFITLATNEVLSNGTLNPTGTPFYTDVPVHRVMDYFMIQTGDPQNGDGTGGSPLGDFDDAFDPNLSFTGRGVLAMANSGADTNDSQFFLTEVPTTWLNQAHMIFGQIISGWDVLEAVSLAATDTSDRPYNAMYLDSVTIFESTQDATFTFTATGAFAGEAHVTITLNDGKGNTATKVITIADEGDLPAAPTVSLPATNYIVFPGESDSFTPTIVGNADVWLDVYDDGAGADVRVDPVTYEVTIDIPRKYKLPQFEVCYAARSTAAAYDNVPPVTRTFYVSPAGLAPTVDVPERAYVAPGEVLQFTADIDDDGPPGLLVGIEAGPTGVKATLNRTTHEVKVTVPKNFTGVCTVTVWAVEGGFIRRGYAADTLYIYSETPGEAPILGHAFGASGAEDMSAVLRGEFLYVAAGTAGLEIFDVSDPTNPDLLDYYAAYDEAWDVAVTDTDLNGSNATVAFVADLTGGVTVLDVSNPSDIQYITALPSYDATIDVYVSGNFLYQSDFRAGLRVYDISDAGNILLADTVTDITEFYTLQWAVACVASGDYAYVLDANGYFFVMDVSDPYDIGFVTGFGTAGRPWDLDLDNDRVYVIDEFTGLIVADVQDPTQPMLIGQASMTSMSWGKLAVEGNLAVISDSNGYKFMDVSDPADMRQSYTFQGPSWSGKGGFQNGRLALPLGRAGTVLLNVEALIASRYVGKSRTFAFADGRTVTIRASGPGTARVYILTDPETIDLLEVVGSTNRTSVTITSRNGDAIIDDIEVPGTIRSLIGKTTDLLGDLTVGGLIATLQLDDVADDHLIALNADDGPVGPRDAVRMTFDHVADTNIDTHGLPISSLTVTDWVDGDNSGSAGTVTAPWIGSLRARGRKSRNPADAVPGNFAANLTLTGADRRGNSLGAANIVGVLTGTWDLTGPDVGNIKSIRAGETGNTWILDAPFSALASLRADNALGGALVRAEWFGKIYTRGDLTAAIDAQGADPRRGCAIMSLYAGSIKDVSLDVNGGIASLFAIEWLDGGGAADQITAPWIGGMTIKGKRSRNPADAIAGDFEANLTLTGADTRGNALAGATIAGQATGVWDLTAAGAGNVGTLKLGSTAATWQLDAPNSVVASLYATGNIAGTQVRANRFGKIYTRGRLNAPVTALGADDRKGLSIASLIAAGVDDAVVDALGGIGAVTVGEWVDSDGNADAGRLEAGWVGKLTVKGRGTSGNFEADVHLDGQRTPARRPVLARALIAGDLDARDWVIEGDMGVLSVLGTALNCTVRAHGSMFGLSLGAADGSDFLAGVDKDLDPANVTQADLDATAQIKYVKIRGWRVGRGDPIPRFVTNSTFLAGSFGAVTLLNAVDQTTYTLYVPSENDIRSVKHTDQEDRGNNYTWRPGQPYPELWVGSAPFETI